MVQVIIEKLSKLNCNVAFRRVQFLTEFSYIMSSVNQAFTRLLICHRTEKFRQVRMDIIIIMYYSANYMLDGHALSQS